MKFVAPALFAALAVAETVTISNFVYVGVNGYPQCSFQLSVDNVFCSADHFVVGGTYTCDDPAWTFVTNEDHGRDIRLSHSVDGKTLSGDFHIRLNGPVPTVLDQIGVSTAELSDVSA